MLRRFFFILCCIGIPAPLSAKIVTLHPTFTAIFSVTPHTAVTRSQYDTDYFTSLGGSLDIVIRDHLAISPGYELGVDTIAGQVSSYSNFSFVLGWLFSPKFEERFKFSGLLANAGGYHSEIYGLGTHITPNAWFEFELTPQYFEDTINTRQIELDGDFDFTISKLMQLNIDGAIGRTYVSHLSNLTSYAAGGGLTLTPRKHLQIFLSVVFAHGLNTDSPYSIINSTSTINTQSGSRVIEVGNTALDPNGNTININLGTTLDF